MPTDCIDKASRFSYNSGVCVPEWRNWQTQET